MAEVVRFVGKSERERARLIREARAMYDSIFPPVDRFAQQKDKLPTGLANGHGGDRGLSS